VHARACYAGLDRHGEPKYRAIDDFSRSLINAATGASEKLHCDTLDVFHRTLREAVKQLGVGYPLACYEVCARGSRGLVRGRHQYVEG
jgi:hypothetical protein